MVWDVPIKEMGGELALRNRRVGRIWKTGGRGGEIQVPGDCVGRDFVGRGSEVGINVILF